jgi:hypothetical protein
VGGLPWLNPADIRGVKPGGGEKKKKKKTIFGFFIFIFPAGHKQPHGAP